MVTRILRYCVITICDSLLIVNPPPGIKGAMNLKS
jgi:hypothetical protein